MVQLRPAQEAIAAYKHGRLAVSAVPGSGKTFTLSLLAGKLLAEGYAGENTSLNPAEDQRVLIVTYLNSSVDTFRARIRKRLEELDLPPDDGYDVRTLHSLALEIVRLSEGGLGTDSSEPLVADDVQTNLFVSQALDNWAALYPDLYKLFMQSDNPREQSRWRNTILKTARSFIRAAKNERFRAHDIQQRLHNGANSAAIFEVIDGVTTATPLLIMLAGIYEQYQAILNRQGVMDFDDLIWQAADLLEGRPDLVMELRRRWPYVLEDEAQDSVPLQEILLSRLTGEDGNWVRVGDPNQAIMSTFTASHPRFFNAFIDRDDVTSLPLPNSGRSSSLIIGAANAVLDWTMDHHPEPEVRTHAFRRQHIVPTPPGDAQPNPPDSESAIEIKVFSHKETEELPAVAKLASDYVRKNPAQTVAILVPTNDAGYLVAEQLDNHSAAYDNLLRGGTREREIAAALNSIIAVLVNPQNKRALAGALESLHELGHPAVNFPAEILPHLSRLLISVRNAESLLFPWAEEDVGDALPAGVASAEDIAHISAFSRFMARMFELRKLPVDDMALAIGDELFAHDFVKEADLAITYQLAIVMRYWQEMHPDWRLPELSAELAALAAGRRRFPIPKPSDYGYAPKAGRISLATQHSAKGLEWDAVFLVGIDGVWIPGDLNAHFIGVHESFGGNPEAEALAQMRVLMLEDAGLYENLTATETAHIEVMCERLRLFYVGITRARRYLHVSRSRSSGSVGREKPTAPATILGLLYHYKKNQESQDSA